MRNNKPRSKNSKILLLEILVRASTTKRAQSRRKALEKMDRLDRPQGDEKQATFSFYCRKASGNVVLQLEDAAIGYDGEIII